jgi:hypothetical protein
MVNGLTDLRLLWRHFQSTPAGRTGVEIDGPNHQAQAHAECQRDNAERSPQTPNLVGGEPSKPGNASQPKNPLGKAIVLSRLSHGNEMDSTD